MSLYLVEGGSTRKTITAYNLHYFIDRTRNVGQDLATFGDVADMSPTCRRHVELS